MIKVDETFFIFENGNYGVEQQVWDEADVVRFNGCNYREGYSVVNKVTNVAEFKTPQLPEAMAAAEQLDIALETKPWEWQRKETVKGDPSNVNPDGSRKDENIH